MKNKLEITISGYGGEFNQGHITREDYEKWKEISNNSSWDEFCYNELELDGYWEVNNISSFTGINLDYLNVKIVCNGNVFFEDTYKSLIQNHFQELGEMPNTKNMSSDYGKNLSHEITNDTQSNDSFSGRNKILVTMKTNEYFNVSAGIELDSEFNIEKLGFDILSTDEMGHGVDYGDFIKNIRYENEYIEIEFPGGTAALDSLEFH